MVRMINGVEDDSSLGSLHALLLMDDTVLFATSREKIIQKFRIVQQFCDLYGMSINVKKTKVMAINSDSNDKQPIISKGIIVNYTSSYLYLGAFITDDANYLSSINLHVDDKRKHFLKFVSFLDKNRDLPFPMKKRVAEACILSAILYGCKTWMCVRYGQLESIYMGIIKSLLSVRKSTCNDLCLVECGLPSLKALINDKRSQYVRQMVNLEEESLLKYAMNMIATIKSPTNELIRNSIKITDWIKLDKNKNMEGIKVNINSTKRKVYLEINPSLEWPTVYSKWNISEHKRIEYTRARLSSHNVKIETGRWIRTPREERLFPLQIGYTNRGTRPIVLPKYEASSR